MLKLFGGLALMALSMGMIAIIISALTLFEAIRGEDHG